MINEIEDNLVNPELEKTISDALGSIIPNNCGVVCIITNFTNTSVITNLTPIGAKEAVRRSENYFNTLIIKHEFLK